MRGYSLLARSSLLITGLWCLICTFLFVYHLDLLINVAGKLKMSYIISATTVIITSGIGINVGIHLLYRFHAKWRLVISLLFSIYLLFLQLLLTIVPSASSCKCTSWRDSIVNIQDWSRVEYAAILFVMNILLWVIMKKRFANRQKHTSQAAMQS